LFLQELREDEPGNTMESSAQANHIGQRASPSDGELAMVRCLFVDQAAKITR